MKVKQTVPVLSNRKMWVKGRGPVYIPRVTHRAAHKKKLPRFRVTCGCCSKQVDIYYDVPDPREIRHTTLEINGVDGGLEDWRHILMPLLGFERRSGEWVDKFHA